MTYTVSIQESQSLLFARFAHAEMPMLPRVKRQLLDYQLMALWHFARQYNRKSARILEIGTGHGGSGYMLSRAAPKATIVSLTTSQGEVDAAKRFWAAQRCKNITAVLGSSWDRLDADCSSYEMIFVDGDHNRIVRDLPWFDRLTDDGLIVFHDYSPQDSRSPSSIVFDELNAMSDRLGRPFDVRIVDEGKVGMAGFYRTAPAPIVPAEPQEPREITRGIVLCSGADSENAAKRAARLGVALVVDDARMRDIKWPRVAYVRAAKMIPWDLVGFAFEQVLERWEVAAPFSGESLANIGADVSDTLGSSWGDLRVPAYSTDIVLVRDSDAGRAFVKAWGELCAEGNMSDEVAFMAALGEIKPLFYALPSAWLWPEERRREADAKSKAGTRKR